MIGTFDRLLDTALLKAATPVLNCPCISTASTGALRNMMDCCAPLAFDGKVAVSSFLGRCTGRSECHVAGLPLCQNQILDEFHWACTVVTCKHLLLVYHYLNMHVHASSARLQLMRFNLPNYGDALTQHVWPSPRPCGESVYTYTHAWNSTPPKMKCKPPKHLLLRCESQPWGVLDVSACFLTSRPRVCALDLKGAVKERQRHRLS